jgi:hypothetical protein
MATHGPCTTSGVVPVDWFATVDECEKNPETARAVPDYQRIACENGAIDPACANRQYSSLVEIRGGETLKYIPPKSLPKSRQPKDVPLAAGFVPIVYLGHKQSFALYCGVLGEQG